MRARLKLYVDHDQQPQRLTEPTTAMPLKDFARIVSDAVMRDRTWLQDFAEDEVHISQDLYELLRVYDEMHRARA